MIYVMHEIMKPCSDENGYANAGQGMEVENTFVKRLSDCPFSFSSYMLPFSYCPELYISAQHVRSSKRGRVIL